MGKFAIEDTAGNYLTTVVADDPIGALNAYAAGEGFGGTYTLGEPDEEAGEFQAYTLEDGRVGGAFTNFEITATPDVAAPEPAPDAHLEAEYEDRVTGWIDDAF